LKNLIISLIFLFMSCDAKQSITIFPAPTKEVTLNYIFRGVPPYILTYPNKNLNPFTETIKPLPEAPIALELFTERAIFYPAFPDGFSFEVCLENIEFPNSHNGFLITTIPIDTVFYIFLESAEKNCEIVQFVIP